MSKKKILLYILIAFAVAALIYILYAGVNFLSLVLTLFLLTVGLRS